MALNFFRQRDIERMDVNDIPEEFINYFDTLDNAAKETLIGTRPELAKALGFVLPETVSESDVDTPNIETEPFSNIQEEEVSQDDIVEEAAVDELEMVQKNFYAGKDLDSILKNNMPELEALAIPDGALTCVLHRKPFENKQINYRNAVTGATYGMILRVCRDCHRVFLEESKMIPIHQALIARNIPHTFYDLELSTQFLRSQMPAYEFSETDFLMIPDTWVEEIGRASCRERV